MDEEIQGHLNGIMREIVEITKRAIELEASNKKLWKRIGELSDGIDRLERHVEPPPY